MLTDDAHRTTHDDGRQPIAIGHLSDSGDLKMFSLSVRGHFLNFGLRARRIKVLFSKPTLYWCIVKTMYCISPDIRIQVCIDILIHPYPTDENSYLTSVTDAWFHSIWSSHLLYIQQNVVPEKKKILIRFVTDYLQKYVAIIISWMARFRLAIFDIDQPNIFP